MATVLFAADPVFVGNLVLVTPNGIAIRLDNGAVINMRLPKSDTLSADSLVRQYKFGDRMTVTGKSIGSYFDEKEQFFYFLELKTAQFLKAPSAQEMTKALGVASWRSHHNLLKVPETKPPVSPPDSTELARIREVNLKKSAELFDFIADEKALRYSRPLKSSKWTLEDTVESEITFQGEGASRQNPRVNGKAVKVQGGWIPGINWGIGFGTALKPLFAPECTCSFESGGTETVDGRQLVMYSFQVPADGCFGPGQIAAMQYNGPTSGRFWADAAQGTVLRLETVGVNTVEEFDVSEGHTTLTWDYVKIGETSHLVPVAGDYLIIFRNGRSWHIDVKYANHRHFESSIRLRFDK
jgi:hypothetical protein